MYFGCRLVQVRLVQVLQSCRCYSTIQIPGRDRVNAVRPKTEEIGLTTLPQTGMTRELMNPTLPRVGSRLVWSRMYRDS